MTHRPGSTTLHARIQRPITAAKLVRAIDEIWADSGHDFPTADEIEGLPWSVELWSMIAGRAGVPLPSELTIAEVARQLRAREPSNVVELSEARKRRVAI